VQKMRKTVQEQPVHMPGGRPTVQVPSQSSYGQPQRQHQTAFETDGVKRINATTTKMSANLHSAFDFTPQFMIDPIIPAPFVEIWITATTSNNT
jgi:hypothetical protein